MKWIVLYCVVAKQLTAVLSVDSNLGHCQLTAWGTWSSCSTSCGNGTQTRSHGICCHRNGTDVECGTLDTSQETRKCGAICPGGNCSFQRLNDTGIAATDYIPLYENVNSSRIFINAPLQILSTESNCELMCRQVSLRNGLFCWAYSYSEVEKCNIHLNNRPFTLAHPEKIGQSVGTSVFLRFCTGIDNNGIVTAKTTAATTTAATTTAAATTIGTSTITTTTTTTTTTTSPAPNALTNSTQHILRPNASCIAKVADVVFVVDSSGSIGIDNFQKIRSFIKDVIMTFDVDPSHTRVALIEYSTVSHIEFKLNEIVNLTDLLTAIDNIQYSGGGTATSDALELLRREGFDGERPDAPDIAVVITDGLSKYPPITRTQANLAKSEGITMFSIGIGNLTDKNELLAIASDKRFLFEVGNYETLVTLNSVIAHMVCRVVLPEKHYTRVSSTPSTTPSGCADLSPDCASYPRDSCTDFEPYARKSCARTCGYCPGFPLVEPACKDELDNCDQYGTNMCYNPAQYGWVDTNCRMFCGFCGNKTELITTAVPTTTEVFTTVSTCQDKLVSCSSYNADLCTNPTYDSWAHLNCPKYCGFCFNYHYVTSSVVNQITCPAWNLPEQCTLKFRDGQCYPFPTCTDGLRLTVKRHR